MLTCTDCYHSGLRSAITAVSTLIQTPLINGFRCVFRYPPKQPCMPSRAVRVRWRRPPRRSVVRLGCRSAFLPPTCMPSGPSGSVCQSAEPSPCTPPPLRADHLGHSVSGPDLDPPGPRTGTEDWDPPGPGPRTGYLGPVDTPTAASTAERSTGVPLRHVTPLICYHLSATSH